MEEETRQARIERFMAAAITGLCAADTEDNLNERAIAIIAANIAACAAQEMDMRSQFITHTVAPRA